jgi:hypothetical protein|tara:strand:- start:849 stop:1256 length:408 start_codon:yes stop_codon:yes gene_type:complete
MKNSVKPAIWGPHGWKFLHYVSLGYPDNPTDEDKINFKNFYYSLQHVLPCEKCALNYKHNLLDSPIDNHLNNRDTLVRWVIDVHNKVNKELNKKELSYEDGISLYLTEETMILDYCFKVVVLIIILAFLYLILKK